MDTGDTIIAIVIDGLGIGYTPSVISARKWYSLYSLEKEKLVNHANPCETVQFYNQVDAPYIKIDGTQFIVQHVDGGKSKHGYNNYTTISYVFDLTDPTSIERIRSHLAQLKL